MLAGWSAIAAAILTVTGLITLLAFFGTGSALLGALNDAHLLDLRHLVPAMNPGEFLESLAGR